MTRKSTSTAILAALALLAALPAARADEPEASPDSKLMIVNGNSGRVVYDDGYDDYLCVYRRHFVGYDDYGRALHRRTMRCR